jgi:Protein of unknwon function (DUF3310)
MKGIYMNALHTQVDGNHYKDMRIQPAEYCHANNIGYLEGATIKYVSRWRKKNGRVDLEKAKHCIELLIALEFGAAAEPEESKLPHPKTFHLHTSVT